MTRTPYGPLYAEYFDLVSQGRDYSKDFDYWSRRIEEAGEPALELGVGTGRFYVPLLERGFDIVGNDISQAMMDRCRAKCRTKGLQPELHEQSMLDFRLPREFGLILLNACGLALFVADEHVHATFESVMANLQPGGEFIYEFNTVPEKLEENDIWTNNSGRWGGDWRRAADGALVAWRSAHRYDVAAHIFEQLFIVERFVDSRLLGTEAYERTGRFHTIDEAVQFAAVSGFEDIRVTQRLSDGPPEKGSRALAVRCRKPA